MVTCVTCLLNGEHTCPDQSSSLPSSTRVPWRCYWRCHRRDCFSLCSMHSRLLRTCAFWTRLGVRFFTLSETVGLGLNEKQPHQQIESSFAVVAAHVRSSVLRSDEYVSANLPASSIAFVVKGTTFVIYDVRFQHYHQYCAQIVIYPEYHFKLMSVIAESSFTDTTVQYFYERKRGSDLPFLVEKRRWQWEKRP